MDVRTVVSLSICCLEYMFPCGLIISWVPLLYTFIDDGIYQDKCVYSNVTQRNNITRLVEDCSAQASTLNMAFTIGIANIGIFAFPFGVLFDRFGLRISRVLASTLSLVGILSWAFASKEYPWLVFVGSLANGMALHSIVTCNSHAAQLAGAKAGTLIAMFTGCVNFSIFWYSNIMILQNNGFHRRWSLLMVASLWILGSVNTFLLLPKFKVGSKKENTEVARSAQNGDVKLEGAKFIDEKGVSSVGAARGVTFYMRCLLYVSHVIWFCIITLRVNMFNGTIVPQLMDMYPDNKDKVGRMLAVLGYLAFVCLFASLPLGLVGDLLRKKFTVKSENLWMKARSSQYTLLIANCLYILLSVFILVPTDWAVYTTFVINWLGVTAFFSYAIVFIAIVFPIRHYGRLYGLMVFSSSVVQFAQVPLLQWAERTSFTNMLLLVLVVTVVALFHPFLIMYKSHRQNKKELMEKSTSVLS